MAAGTKTLKQDSLPNEHLDDGIHCMECPWRGTLGQLLIADHDDSDALYCPRCARQTWTWD